MESEEDYNELEDGSEEEEFGVENEHEGYEIRATDKVQAPYHFLGENKARNEARNPTLVLDDKLDFLPGKSKRIKEKHAYQYRDTSHKEAFNRDYKYMRRDNEKQDADAIYDSLNAILPDITSRNVRVLAGSYLIYSRLNDKDLNNPDFVEEFDTLLTQIWSKFAYELRNFQNSRTKIRKNAKKDEELPAKETQKIDFLRTVRNLATFYELQQRDQGY